MYVDAKVINENSLLPFKAICHKFRNYLAFCDFKLDCYLGA